MSNKLRARQHEGNHDIHGCLQHGSWPAGRVGADRARERERRRLAGAALARAHSSRHVREVLGNDDHDPAARGHSGRREKHNRGPFPGTWPAPRQRGHHGRHADDLPSCRAVLHLLLATSYLQPCDVAVFRSFESCIQTQATTTLARCVLDGIFDDVGREQSMAAPVFGRMGVSRSHGATRTRLGQLGTISARLLERPTSCTLATCSRNRSNQSPLPKTLWSGP